ncbi:MAG: alpha/beta hydrolase [Chloroflexales bacterium]|nr:alpha/beta hydrolase [Chloroflexales bacterium]
MTRIPRRRLLQGAIGTVGALGALAAASAWPTISGIAGRVVDGYANNNGVRTHYVTLGKGPLVVLIHGIPEFWYSWRHQIEPLAQRFQVVAIDQRGFNQSDKPADRSGYHVRHLVADVAAVIQQMGQERAFVVGHDAGAWVAWHFATAHPERTAKLCILSVPHPNALAEELAQNPAQHAAGQYARDMQMEGAAPSFRVGPVGIARDAGGWPLYLAAERRTDPAAITSFYQESYPRAPYAVDPALDQAITAPTLVIHGQNDQFLLASGHKRNARWMSTPPETVLLDAGHFVHQEAPEQVNQLLLDWLSRA